MTQFSISLAFVLKSEAYERVENMVFIDSMECKVANPLQFIRNDMQEGALRDFKRLASQLNATKTVSIVVKSEEVQGGVTKRDALEFIRFFSSIVTGTTFDRKNKLIIKGRKRGDVTEHEELIQDDVNFLLNKIQGSFTLDEPNVASHVQAVDRKRGITEVYEQYRDEIARIIGYV